MIAQHSATRMARPLPDRAALRLFSLSWALIAGVAALVVGLLLGLVLARAGEAGSAALLQAGLRAGGCGLFQGLLAFHLQRVDPDDGHLQAGLVGAVCGIHSLGLPLELTWPAAQPLTTALTVVLPAVMMELLRAWLPIVGGALVLHVIQRLTPALRP